MLQRKGACQCTLFFSIHNIRFNILLVNKNFSYLKKNFLKAFDPAERNAKPRKTVFFTPFSGGGSISLLLGLC